jgi:hypothetical protein
MNPGGGWWPEHMTGTRGLRQASTLMNRCVGGGAQSSGCLGMPCVRTLQMRQVSILFQQFPYEVNGAEWFACAM